MRHPVCLRPTGDGTLPPPLFSVRWWCGYVLAFSWRRAFERAVLEGHMTTSARHALTSSCMAVTVCVIQNPSDMRRWLTSDNCTAKKAERPEANSTLAVVVKDIHIHILLCHFYAFEIPLTVAAAVDGRNGHIAFQLRNDWIWGASVSEFITPLTRAVTVTSGWIQALFVSSMP